MKLPMKKLILLFVLCTSGLLCKTTYAQIKFSVNIDLQPIWGPVGYDHVEYYFLPEIDAYYYVPTQKYIFEENGSWVTRDRLPERYRGHDMYNTRKVVINEPKPYLHHQENREKYGHQNEHSNQQNIRDSHESKYFENKNHPEHSKWKEQKKNEKKHGQQHNEQQHNEQQHNEQGNERRNN
jgi:hypothetical protein